MQVEFGKGQVKSQSYLPMKLHFRRLVLPSYNIYTLYVQDIQSSQNVLVTKFYVLFCLNFVFTFYCVASHCKHFEGLNVNSTMFAIQPTSCISLQPYGCLHYSFQMPPTGTMTKSTDANEIILTQFPKRRKKGTIYCLMIVTLQMTATLISTTFCWS